MSTNWQHNGKWFKKFYAFEDAINAAKEISKRRSIAHKILKCRGDDDEFILCDCTVTSSEALDAHRAFNEQDEQIKSHEEHEMFENLEEDLDRSFSTNEEYPEEDETYCVSSDGELMDTVSDAEQIDKDFDWSSRTFDDLDSDYWERHYDPKNIESPD